MWLRAATPYVSATACCSAVTRFKSKVQVESIRIIVERSSALRPSVAPLKLEQVLRRWSSVQKVRAGLSEGGAWVS